MLNLGGCSYRAVTLLLTLLSYLSFYREIPFTVTLAQFTDKTLPSPRPTLSNKEENMTQWSF